MGFLYAFRLKRLDARISSICYNKLMLLFSMLGWWYSRGWIWVSKFLLITRNKRILDFFSVADLSKTLFAPFRQDVVDTKNAPIGDKLQALGGNLISRLLGFLIRLLLILLGLAILVLNSIFGILVVLLWPLIPFAPLVSLLLVMLGVGFINV